MARDGTKTGGRDFEPGNQLGINGRTPLPEDIKQARKLNKIEFERILNEYIHLTSDEIKKRLTETATPAIELLVAKIIVMGVNKGDEKRLNFILDRLIGAVKTKVSLDGGEDGSAVNLATKMSDEQLDSRLSELVQKMAIKGGES